jgi:hypothetical protein
MIPGMTIKINIKANNTLNSAIIEVAIINVYKLVTIFKILKKMYTAFSFAHRAYIKKSFPLDESRNSMGICFILFNIVILKFMKAFSFIELYIIWLNALMKKRSRNIPAYAKITAKRFCQSSPVPLKISMIIFIRYTFMMFKLAVTKLQIKYAASPHLLDENKRLPEKITDLRNKLTFSRYSFITSPIYA